VNEKINIEPGDSILVSRTDRLGDLILAIPFAETLKVRYPEARVDVLASLYASPVLEENPRIDNIVRVQNDQLVSSRPYYKDLERKIKKTDYKVVIALYPERNISRLFKHVDIPHRLGTAGRFHSVFFNHRLMHSRKANKKHELEYNLDFLTYFIDGETIKTPVVHPIEKEMNHARRLVAEAGISGDFIIIHPGSGGSAERWSMVNFIKLYKQLNDQGTNVLITGSEVEGEIIEKEAFNLGVKLVSIAGKTDLRTLAAVLSLADSVVANSTGPLHLAAAVGTRVVGLYPSKKIMSPVRWGPVGERHQVIQPIINECQCPSKQCQCMNTISVDSVYEIVKR